MKSISNKISRLPLLAVIACLILCLGGCRKAPINGKLDGQWQIMSVETPDTVYTPAERVYICFNLHVVNLTNLHNDVYAGNLSYSDGRIAMDFPYQEHPSQMKVLNRWGIYANPVVFDVAELTGSRLLMVSPQSTITLRRF